MVDKGRLTITFKELEIYLLLTTRGYDVFMKDGLMDMYASFSLTKQYQIIFGHSKKAQVMGYL
jgi:hypothetical protein